MGNQELPVNRRKPRAPAERLRLALLAFFAMLTTLLARGAVVVTSRDGKKRLHKSRLHA